MQVREYANTLVHVSIQIQRQLVVGADILTDRQTLQQSEQSETYISASVQQHNSKLVDRKVASSVNQFINISDLGLFSTLKYLQLSQIPKNQKDLPFPRRKFQKMNENIRFKLMFYGYFPCSSVISANDFHTV